MGWVIDHILIPDRWLHVSQNGGSKPRQLLPQLRFATSGHGRSQASFLRRWWKKRDMGSSILTGTELIPPRKNPGQMYILKIERMLKYEDFLNASVILSLESLGFAQESSTTTQHSIMMFHVFLRICCKQQTGWNIKYLAKL